MVIDRLMIQLNRLEKELENAKAKGCGKDILDELQAEIDELDCKIDAIREDMYYENKYDEHDEHDE